MFLKHTFHTLYLISQLAMSTTGYKSITGKKKSESHDMFIRVVISVCDVNDNENNMLNIFLIKWQCDIINTIKYINGSKTNNQGMVKNKTV